MKRLHKIYPGHDCIYDTCKNADKPCSQPPDLERPMWNMPGNNHGISGDTWYYAVLSDDLKVALSLMVHTDILPATVPANHAERCDRYQPPETQAMLEMFNHILGPNYVPPEETRFPRGADLSLHRARALGTPPGEDSVTSREHCDLFGGPCDVPNTTSLGADEFFRAHGDPSQPEQSEAFWAALEAKFAEWTAAEGSGVAP